VTIGKDWRGEAASLFECRRGKLPHAKANSRINGRTARASTSLREVIRDGGDFFARDKGHFGVIMPNRVSFHQIQCSRNFLLLHSISLSSLRSFLRLPISFSHLNDFHSPSCPKIFVGINRYCEIACQLIRVVLYLDWDTPIFNLPLFT
jgi:hypothetical protein